MGLSTEESVEDSSAERTPLLGDGTGSSRPTEDGLLLSRGVGLLLLATLAVSNLFAAVSFSVLSPFFPEAAEGKGVSLTLAGLIVGEFELVIFLVSPFVGHIAAPVGNKFVYICGLIICGACSLLFGWLEYCPGGATFVAMCLLTRGVGAVGAAMFLVSSFAILARAFPDRVSTVTGIVETALGIGYMVGPALGGTLFDAGGFKLPMFTVGGLVLVTAVAAYVATPSLIVSRDEHSRPVSMLRLFQLPMVVAILLSYSATGALYGMLDVSMEPYLSSAFHFSSTVIGFVFLLPSLIYSLSAIAWGHLTDSFGWGIGVLIFGLLASTLGLCFIDPASFLFHWAPSLYALVPALVCIGLGTSAVMIPVYGLCLDEAYKYGFGRDIATINLVSGVTSSAYSFGVFLGPTIGGHLYETVGFEYLLLGYAGLFVVCALILGTASVCSRRATDLSSEPDDDDDDDSPALGEGDSQESGTAGPTGSQQLPVTAATGRRYSISSVASHYSHQYSVQFGSAPTG